MTHWRWTDLWRAEAGRRTLAYYWLFVSLGLGLALGGPTLPALAAQTGVPVAQMGYVFLAGSAGFTLGTWLAGQVFDRLRGHPLLGLAQLLSAACLALVPLAPNLGLLLVLLFCRGIMDGAINTGANTLLVWTHRQRAGPFMSGLHFAFGLGAFGAPLLAAQLAPTGLGYQAAYWAVAGFAALGGLRLLALGGSPQPEHHSPETPAGARRTSVPYGLVAAAALFLFFYVGAEVAFGGWIYTYALTLRLADATSGAYLNSAFWLSFTVGRLLSIPVAARFAPQKVILAALLGCLAFVALIVAFPASSPGLWAASVGLGFCMAPVWPAGFTLAGRSLQLTARLSGLILLGDSLGGMFLPWLAGQVIGLAGAGAMIYLVGASLAANLLALGALLRLRPRERPDAVGLPPQSAAPATQRSSAD